MLAVLDTNDRGGADVKIKIPEDMENQLVFYYQLRFADRERRREAKYRGAVLERFVFQTMIDNSVMFSVHVPTPGEYFFEIFANKLDDKTRRGSIDSGSGIEDPNAPGVPFRLKCACKFKIVCKTLTGKMHPLPDCASGEWGPKKGFRHFGLKAIQPEQSDSSSDGGSTDSAESPDNPRAGIVNVEDCVEVKFRIPRPLQFVAKLKMNYVEDKVLDKFLKVSTNEDIMTVTVTPPQLGQFGLDIYARPKEATQHHTLSHACKYLLNAVKITNPVDIPKDKTSGYTRQEKWGPTSQFEEFGMKAVSHKESKFSCVGSNQCTIEIGVPENIHLSYQFLREPDEDCREYISKITGETTPRTEKLFINMPRAGHYMLSLYARQEISEDKSMKNVFNYLISYKGPAKASNGSTLGLKEKERSSSIFRKSIFSSKKDKEKGKEMEKSKAK